MSLRSSWSPADLYLPMRRTSGCTPALSSAPRRKVPLTDRPRSDSEALGGA
jgi:hypothetical protein